MMESLKIAIFSAGRRAYDYITEKHKSRIVAVFDNDSSKWGKKIGEYEILPPQQIINIKFDYLVIATIYEEEIKRQIIKKYPDLTHKICSVNKMNCLEYVYHQYMRRYKKDNHIYDVKNKKIVIYTGIFGKYDTLCEPLFIDENIDYVCYTDDKNLLSDHWKIRYVECEQDNMALEVRKYKCLPHRFLSEYDISIWIDARLQITSSIVEYIKKYMRDTGMLFFPHYTRDCVYEEAAANIENHREDVKKIVVQMYQYLQMGYPEHNGLYCGTCIVREHNRMEIIKIMEEWYQEILRTTARDQISLPYVMWKNDFLPDICKEYVWENELWRTHNHNE